MRFTIRLVQMLSPVNAVPYRIIKAVTKYALKGLHKNMHFAPEYISSIWVRVKFIVNTMSCEM